MRHLAHFWIAAILTILPLCCAANDRSTTTSSAYVADSPCTRPDQIVFSCPLLHSKRIVSICASRVTGPRRFYYAFGKPHALEMTYNAALANPASAFGHSYLSYGSGTGGYAYSFVKEGMKYIVYSISGAHFDRAGVTIQKTGEIKALENMPCAHGKAVTANDRPLLYEISKWPVDEETHQHGVPSVD